MRIRLQIVNESPLLDDVEGAKIAKALQRQIDVQFRPTWGTAAKIEFVPRGSKADPNAWWIVATDDADQAGALGYHDLTPALLPVGKAFAKTTQEAGAEISVTIGHETLEMLGDPWINRTVLDPRSGKLYAEENCDAVEADEFGIEVEGVLLSDFVLPQFFDYNHARKGVKLSYGGHVTEPFEIARGGYLSFLDLRHVDEGWHQVGGERIDAEEVAGVRPAGFPRGSRRERRRRLWSPHDRLRVSTVECGQA
jgi:hypothetical protein